MVAPPCPLLCSPLLRTLLLGGCPEESRLLCRAYSLGSAKNWPAYLDASCVFWGDPETRFPESFPRLEIPTAQAVFRSRGRLLGANHTGPGWRERAASHCPVPSPSITEPRGFVALRTWWWNRISSSSWTPQNSQGSRRLSCMPCWGGNVSPRPTERLPGSSPHRLLRHSVGGTRLLLLLKEAKALEGLQPVCHQQQKKQSVLFKRPQAAGSGQRKEATSKGRVEQGVISSQPLFLSSALVSFPSPLISLSAPEDGTAHLVKD